MSYLFTSESVSEGHPDKIADQISDALLDEFLKQDPESKVACEILVTTGLIIISGEVTTDAWVDHHNIARKVVKNIGYTKSSYCFEYSSCGVISTLHEQSPDIRMGVIKKNPKNKCAGDQGMMFGYACNEMKNYMLYFYEVANILLQELANIRKEGKVMQYLGPDSKSQVTLQYNDHQVATKIHTIVISTQHDDIWNTSEEMQEAIEKDIRTYLFPRVKASNVVPEEVRKLFDQNDFKLLINPTGKFVIGGPHGDTGLTGRKIIVDTYGGHGAHGGGSFSGKDPSKVDRSGTYAMRYIAKNAVAAGLADKILLQVAYAIGVPQPLSLFVNTYGTAKVNMSDIEIAEKLLHLFDLTPYGIITKFQLKNPIYLPTATYGHFGRDVYEKEIEVSSRHIDAQKRIVNGQTKYFKNITFFPWEKLDSVELIRNEFKIKL